MKNFKNLLFAALFLIAATVIGQTKISGTIVDETNEGLPGASVVIKGTTNGTETDFNGKFMLTASTESGTIVVSYLGFKTTEFAFTSAGDLGNIKLEEDGNILEEVVQDKDYDLNPNAELKLKVSLLFFDIKKTNLQIAVYSKKTDIYQISARATLYKGKKKKKSVTATGEASEVSTATLLIDEGGQFSQANVSTALKKVVEQLINKLKL